MFRKVLIAILSFLFVVLATYFTLFAGLVSTFTDKGFYVEDFSSEAYDFMQSELRELVAGLDVDGLDSEDLDRILSEIYPENEFKDYVASEYDRLANLQADEEGVVELSVSLAWVDSKRSELAFALAEELGDGSEELEDEASALAVALDSAIFSKIPDQLGYQIQVPQEARSDVPGFFNGVLSFIFWFGVVLLLLILAALLLVTPYPWSNVLRVQLKSILGFSFLINLVLLIISNFPIVLETTLDTKVEKMVLSFYSVALKATAQGLYLFTVPLFVASVIAFVVLKLNNKRNDA